MKINVGQHPWLLAAGCWLLPCCRRRSWCELPSLPLFDFFVFLLPASAGLLPCFAPNAPHAQVGLPHFHPLPPRLGRRHVSPTASCPASRRGHDRQDCRSESWWGLHWWDVAALVVGGQEQAAPLSQALRPQPHWVVRTQSDFRAYRRDACTLYPMYCLGPLYFCGLGCPPCVAWCVAWSARPRGFSGK